MIMTHDAALLLLFLLMGHALADFPLQPAILADSKCPHSATGKIPWPYALSAHAVIHGGFVGAFTGSAVLALAETVAHAVTDWLKCENRIGAGTDQAIHVLCKVVWFAVYLGFAR